MSTSRKSELIVGAFVLVAFITLMGMSFLIKGGTGPGSYQVRMQYRDVSGLDIGSPVLVSGFRTGQVSRMDSTFDQDGNPAVIVTARVSRSIPIYQDAVAMMNQQGFIGDKQIEIDPGTPEKGEIERNQMITARPFSALAQFLPGGEESFEDIQVIISNIREMTENRERIDAIDEVLANLALATEEITLLVRENRQALTTTLANVEELSERSLRVAESADRFLENANQQMEIFGGQFETLVTEFRETNSELQRRIHAVGDRADRIGSNAETIVEESRRELEAITRNLTESSERINQLLKEAGEGEGTIGRLLRDPRPFDDLQDSISALRAVLIREREGMHERAVPYLSAPGGGEAAR